MKNFNIFINFSKKHSSSNVFEVFLKYNGQRNNQNVENVKNKKLPILAIGDGYQTYLLSEKSSKNSYEYSKNI
jgi:hypothetical protein